jgi:hypothetical protein
MRRLIGLLILAVLAFYIAWPAWSAYRISGALEGKDAALLDVKVDFPAVRESLRPAVSMEMDKRIDKEMQALGPAARAMGGDLKAKMLPKLVEQVLATIVTPDNVIRIVHDGGDIAKSVEKIMTETAGQMGALTGGMTGGMSGGGAPAGAMGGILGQVMGAASGGNISGGSPADISAIAGSVLGARAQPGAAPSAPAPTTASTPAAKRTFGLGNIKGFGFAGPLGFDIAVARDAAQPKADGTVGMSFTGGDWKLTRVIPNL